MLNLELCTGYLDCDIPLLIILESQLWRLILLPLVLGSCYNLPSPSTSSSFSASQGGKWKRFSVLQWIFYVSQEVGSIRALKGTGIRILELGFDKIMYPMEYLSQNTSLCWTVCTYCKRRLSTPPQSELKTSFFVCFWKPSTMGFILQKYTIPSASSLKNLRF